MDHGAQVAHSVSDESIKFNNSCSLTEDFDTIVESRVDYHAEKSIELVSVVPAASVEVVVSSPQNNNSIAGPYTTYLLSGNVADFNFSVRKRYSDFIWLRQRLQESYPGVLIPPLPAKQKLGRFTEEFIETRRHQLELFLSRFLRTPAVSMAGLTRSWLVTPCFTMSDLKSTYPPTRSSLVRGGLDSFCEYVLVPNNRPRTVVEKRSDDLSALLPSLVACKTYLFQHESFLAEMRKTLRDGVIKDQAELISHLLSVTGSSHSLHHTLEDMVSRFKIRGISLSFYDIEPMVMDTVPRLEASKQSWLRVLASICEAHEEVAAMLEALESLTDLIKDHTELVGMPYRRESVVEGLLRQATINFRSWWQSKAQLDPNAVKLVDLEVLRDWCILAADFFIEVELPRFCKSLNELTGHFDKHFNKE